MFNCAKKSMRVKELVWEQCLSGFGVCRGVRERDSFSELINQSMNIRNMMWNRIIILLFLFYIYIFVIYYKYQVNIYEVEIFKDMLKGLCSNNFHCLRFLFVVEEED